MSGYARHRPVSCTAGRKYHRWHEVPAWLQIVPVDHALRLCDHCGANGRANGQGVIELVVARHMTVAK